jgi:pectinesterase
MDGHIRPEGWDNWGNGENEETAWFGEAGSTGPGANPRARVPWAHRILPAGAAAFTAAAFLAGNDGWNPVLR